MIRPFLSARWQTLAALVLAGSAVAVSACSNTDTSAAAQPLARHASELLPYNFTYKSVDDPNGSNTAVTGINDSKDIIGTYCVICGGSNPIDQSFTGTPTNLGNYTIFGDNYPQPFDIGTYALVTGTDLVAISPGATPTPAVEAGWADNPGEFFYTLGLINNQGLWTVLHDFDNGGGEKSKAMPCKKMELNGINDAYTAVGFYTKGNGCSTYVDQAFEAVGEKFTEIPFNSSLGFHNTVATGIDDPNMSGSDVVGWGTLPLPKPPTEAWFEQRGGAPVIFTIHDHVSAADRALGINADGKIVVGSYSVGSTTYGFLCTAPCDASSTFQTVSAFSSSDTVVYGINDSNDICGSYVDSKGQHGFVATPVSGSKPLRQHQVQSHSPPSLRASSAGPSL
jgi:hypothetical protein